MAPGTNAGASHPVVEGAKLDDTMKQKLENDTAALLRSYTAQRGRNPQAAEDAVRNSKSYTDQEAKQLGLIDLIAPDTQRPPESDRWPHHHADERRQDRAAYKGRQRSIP